MGTRAEGTFEVAEFRPAEVAVPAEVSTEMPVGLATMCKTFSGDVDGNSATWFTGCRDEETGAGSYVAMEAFHGRLNGVEGGFNFLHVASTHGQDRYGEFFAVVGGSGSGGLAGITGGGGLAIDPDGTHRIWFDYDLGDA